MLKKIIDKNARCRLDGVSRSYMFFGPPGSGKSSFAHKIGINSKRVIKFDAKSMDAINVESVSFLLSELMPEFVIIDDFDRVIYGSSVATMLCILETVKLDFPNTTIIVTTNNTSGLDPALFRAGRLDEPIKFDIQNDGDRRDILRSYADQFKVKLSKRHVNKIIKKTRGLSAAYMKEIIVQMKYSSMEDVLDIIETMKGLLHIDETYNVVPILSKKKDAKTKMQK